MTDNHPSVGHEESDVNVGGIFIFAVGLLVTAVIVHLLVWMMFAYFAGRETRRAIRQFPLASQQQPMPPSPRLQVNPREDLRELRAGEDAVLNNYGWVDKDNGIARIPIAEAMKLTVQRGLPAREKQ